jgi:hypothetical protein
MSENEVAEKLMDLYVLDVPKHLVMRQNGEYQTVHRVITLQDIHRHMQGICTIGVYPTEGKSKFICFDIDTKDISVLEDVILANIQYVPLNAILCSYSGTKGYHVEVFFEKLIDKETIDKYYRLILSDTGYDESLVECRGNGNQGVKLPLGRNFRNKESNQQYCYISNMYGVKVIDSYSAIMKLEKVNSKLIYDAIEINCGNGYFTTGQVQQVMDLKSSIRSLPIYNQGIGDKVLEIESLIENGLRMVGTRHNSMYKIALYLKSVQGYSSLEIKDFLIGWIEKCDSRYYRSSLEEIEKDISDTVECIFRNNYTLKVNARDIMFTSLDYKEIISVKGRVLRNLYFIIYTHCKAYGDSDGEFYMTYEQIAEAGGIRNNRAENLNRLIALQQLGKIEIVRRNHRLIGQEKHSPNRYRVIALCEMKVKESEGFIVCPNRSTKCLDCVMCHLADNSTLKEVCGRKYKQVRALFGKCDNDVNRRKKKTRWVG